MDVWRLEPLFLFLLVNSSGGKEKAEPLGVFRASEHEAVRLCLDRTGEARPCQAEKRQALFVFTEATVVALDFASAPTGS